MASRTLDPVETCTTMTTEFSASVTCVRVLLIPSPTHAKFKTGQHFGRRGPAEPQVLAGVPLGGRDPLSSLSRCALQTELDTSRARSDPQKLKFASISGDKNL